MSKSYSFGRVTRFHCVVVLHDPTLFWIWRNGGSEEFRVRDDVEIKVFMHLYSPLLFQLLSICFLLKISQVIWSTKCILKNIPLLSEGRIRSCPYEQVLSILVLVSNCKLGWGGCLWSKGRLLIPVLDICGTCCLVLEWASWLFVLEFHFPSSLVNSNRKLLFFLL